MESSKGKEEKKEFLMQLGRLNTKDLLFPVGLYTNDVGTSEESSHI